MIQVDIVKLTTAPAKPNILVRMKDREHSIDGVKECYVCDLLTPSEAKEIAEFILKNVP